MKKKTIFISKVLLILVIVFFFIQLEKSVAIDPYYVVCSQLPGNCGSNLNISFPFYINGTQNSSCGYPGFSISCNKDGNPTINITENEYVIDRIDYQEQIIRVHNAAIGNSSNSICDHQQLKNVLPNNQFEYVNDVARLYLFSYCTNSTVERLQDYKVACGNEYKQQQVFELAMLDNDEKLKFALEGCSNNVVVPMEAGGSRGGIVDYKGLLRKGFSMKWKATNCTRCEESGGHCGFDYTSSRYSFACFCPDRPHRSSCKNPKKSKLGIILGTESGHVPSDLYPDTCSVGAALLILVIAIVVLLIWRCKRGKIPCLLSRNNSDSSSTEGVYFGLPVFSYQELKEIANNFSESNELGDGGFGTVYYGKLCDGREVAVKRLYEHSFKRIQQFMNEVEILTQLRHRNLVSLYGCTSRHSRELLLVYEYVPNGTIADHLHGDRAKDNSLTWPRRLKIAIETADALAYLHASAIIHRDVKTNNILLDHNFCVKVADFGLSRLFPNNVSHVSTAPQGTAGYVDPEYHQSYQLTEKSDVYSFGVVLIELISSMPAIDISRHSNEINLANYATSRIQRRAFDELIDPTFRKESDTDVMRMTTSVAELAFRCLQLERDLRPTMDEIVETLKAIQSKKESFDENCGAAADESRSSNVSLSHELEDVMSKKQPIFLSSPNSVTDLWVSVSTPSSSSM